MSIILVGQPFVFFWRVDGLWAANCYSHTCQPSYYLPPQSYTQTHNIANLNPATVPKNAYVAHSTPTRTTCKSTEPGLRNNECVTAAPWTRTNHGLAKLELKHDHIKPHFLYEANLLLWNRPSLSFVGAGQHKSGPRFCGFGGQYFGLDLGV